MDVQAYSHYRNLKDLSRDEWLNLDIHLFIAANFNRYCGLLIKKIGYQHLPSDAMESLLGLYCAVGYKPLASVHARHLDAEGEKRNQVMLGTLKTISVTRMVDAVINEFPAYISIDRVDVDADELAKNVAEPTAIYSWGRGHETSLYTEEDFPESPEDIEQRQEEIEKNRSMRVELLRHHLTVSQYQTFRHMICDHMDIQQLAEITGTTLTNIRIMLLNIRRKLHGLLSPDMAKEFEDCLYRN